MANQKITALADLPTPVGADLFVTIDDVAGTPISKKATLTNVQAVIDHDALTNFTATEHFTEASINHANITAGDGSDHADVVINTTHISSDGTNHANVVLNDTHRADNTQAHSDYLLNSATDIGVGLTLTGDNGSADTQYTAQVLYNTDATPPAASGFPIGTIYIQYTA